MPAIVLHAVAQCIRPHNKPREDQVQAFHGQWLWPHPMTGVAVAEGIGTCISQGCLMTLELVQTLATISPGIRVAILGAAFGQEVFLEEWPFKRKEDKIISALSSSLGVNSCSQQGPSLWIQVARRPLRREHRDGVRNSQVVEQWMAVGEWVIVLYAKDSQSVEVVRRWDMVRQYLQTGDPASAMLCR